MSQSKPGQEDSQRQSQPEMGADIHLDNSLHDSGIATILIPGLGYDSCGCRFECAVRPQLQRWGCQIRCSLLLAKLRRRIGDPVAQWVASFNFFNFLWEGFRFLYSQPTTERMPFSFHGYWASVESTRRICTIYSNTHTHTHMSVYLYGRSKSLAYPRGYEKLSCFGYVVGPMSP